MSPKSSKRKPAKPTASAKRPAKRFTDEEREAMQDRVRELKAEAGRAATAGGDVAGVLAKIAAMPEPDRTMAGRIHAIVTAAAPAASPRLWYGMPAYSKAGKVFCFFQNARKFKTRYSTLGFSDSAKLDDGTMWPTGFALKTLTAADEARISALVVRAVS